MIYFYQITAQLRNSYKVSRLQISITDILKFAISRHSQIIETIKIITA